MTTLLYPNEELIELRAQVSRITDRIDTIASILPVASSSRLSKSEESVLRLVMAGKTNREIGHTLFIQENTVKYHTKQICDKLGVQTRIQAAVWGAVHLGTS